jgi:ATP-binding cassette, subfamily F, member 3
MAKLTARMSEIDAALADPTLYERDPARVAVLAKERADAAAALAAAEEAVARAERGIRERGDIASARCR